MTELMQSARATQDSENGVATAAEPEPQPRPVSRGSRRLRWHWVAWFACGSAGILAIGWFILLSRGESGSKAEWFFGAAVFCVVMVTMWQMLNIQRQADRNAVEAAERLRTELAAAEERAARELALTQALHQVEMQAREKLYRAEVQAQRELARTERTHLVNQLQKQSMIEVTRTVNRHTRMLATLWNEGARLLYVDDRAEREQAMAPIFDQIGRIVNDFSIEIANAHLLVEDERLHQALNHVNEAVLLAVRVAQDVHEAVLEKRAPQKNPFPAVQRLMQTRAAEARSLAWELLRAGLDSPGAAKE